MRLIKIGIILLCFLAFSAMLTLAGNIVARYGELNVTGDLYVKDALFVDSSSNRVGIGTKNPGYSLDVDGKIYSSDDICIEGKCLSSAGSGGGGGTFVGRTSNMY
ncbi:hypothetical protein KY358_04935, partial [Candidatus Woesearchaeota archaeon]|nr:hypothetical protein [Candidatus Woesearchaeota archaeon]